ncbi:MAG TPA: tryptophan synthase subunit alpha [Bacteroidota bacterium]|nr:tryptophan synthase subunit alpha [Bacteroidota bacterium]
MPVNRIHSAFQQLRASGRKALIPYITPEFPVRGATVPLILELVERGATHVEIGIPFSDPIADGVTIQRSSHIALEHGASIGKVLGSVKEARARTDVPLILMGYFNPMVRYGIEKFLTDAVACGVDGVIVPDLLPEESVGWRKASSIAGISNVFLMAPTTPPSRMAYLDSISTDFSYCVSVTGVTGARTGFGDAAAFESFLDRVRKNTSKPFVVGFGISNRGQIETVCRSADGVVVGSALLRSMEAETTIDGAVRAASRFFSALVQG